MSKSSANENDFPYSVRLRNEIRHMIVSKEVKSMRALSQKAGVHQESLTAFAGRPDRKTKRIQITFETGARLIEAAGGRIVYPSESKTENKSEPENEVVCAEPVEGV